MKIIYGPVALWRLGKSLGVDLICSPKKICSFDCIYCQLKHTECITANRQTFVPSEKVKNELKQALSQTTPDVITPSGMGGLIKRKRMELQKSKFKERFLRHCLLPVLPA